MKKNRFILVEVLILDALKRLKIFQLFELSTRGFDRF